MTRRHDAKLHFRVGLLPGPRSKIVNLLRTYLFARSRPSPAPDPRPAESLEDPIIENFRAEFNAFAELARATSPRFKLDWDDRYPCLNDRTDTTPFDRHYVYHTAWAARVLAATRPEYHIDISGYIYFCAIVSAFVPVRFYDYRPANLRLSQLDSEPGDLTCLPFADQSIASLSCMHVIEHIGLGRYGDPLDSDGDLKAMNELKRVLAPEGDLLFVVPTGYPRICFNAHRIYSPEQIIEIFSDLQLKELALIPDRANDGDLVVDPGLELLARQSYGCGCFWFRRAS